MSRTASTTGGRRAWLSSRSGALKAGRLLASLAATLLGLLLITFLIGRVMPIDPVLAVVGERATNEVYMATRAAMGLDDPLIVQFFNYLREVLTGNFGNSLLTSRPVIDDIARVFPATLELATVATLIGVTLGIPAGVLAAVHQGRWPDHLVRLIGLFGDALATVERDYVVPVDDKKLIEAAHSGRVLMLSATAVVSPLNLGAIGLVLGLFTKRDYWSWLGRYGVRRGFFGGLAWDG